MIKYKKFILWAVVGLGLIGVYIYFSSPREVTISLNGNSETIMVNGPYIKDALDDAGIKYDPSVDWIVTAPESLLLNNQSIEVNNAQIILVHSANGSIKMVTPENDLMILLPIAGVSISPGDSVLLNGQPFNPNQLIPYAPRHQVEIVPSSNLVIETEGEEIISNSGMFSVGEIVHSAGIPIILSDIILPQLDSAPTSSKGINIASSYSVGIKSNGIKLASHSQSENIGLALANIGIPLQGIDYSLPVESEFLASNSRIQVVNIEEEIIIEQTLTAYTTISQPVPDLPIDNFNVVQLGENGIDAKRVRIRYEDGQEVSRITEDAWTVKLPSPLIEGYGTNIQIKSMDTSNGQIRYWRALEFYATSYHPGEMNKNNPWFGKVYCGGDFQAGFVAVDLRYVPCGTRLYIPGYGVGIAMDTGRIRGAWIDLGYLEEEYIPWAKNLTVYFLAPAPPESNIAWKIPPGTTY